MEDAIIELFEDLIKQWKMCEETVINDRGTLEDYELLENEEAEFREKLKNILVQLRD